MYFHICNYELLKHTLCSFVLHFFHSDSRGKRFCTFFANLFKALLCYCFLSIKVLRRLKHQLENREEIKLSANDLGNPMSPNISKLSKKNSI